MVPTGMVEGVRNAPTTRSGFILVSNYAWMCVVVAVTIARFGQGYSHKVELGPDDAAIVAATIFFLGDTVAWQYSVNGGLGKEAKKLSVGEVDLFFKAIYVALILAVFAAALSKLSSAFLIERVVAQTRGPRLLLFGMIAVWIVFSTFAISFQCGVPQWSTKSLQCGNSGLIVGAIGFNMITDLMLALWLIPTLWQLTSDKEKSISTTLLFGARVVVPLVSVGQIWAVLKVGSSPDPSRDAADLVVLTQSVTSLSLIVASIPRIKRILGVGGSGIAYPHIQATEMSLSRRSLSRQDTRSTEPQLVPFVSYGRLTVPISSKGGEKKLEAMKPPPDRPSLTMWTPNNDHTSTSSLFDRDEMNGVTMQRDIIGSFEENDASGR